VNRSNLLPWFWDSNELHLVVDVGRPVASISNEDIVKALEASAAAWSHEMNPCTVLRIDVTTKDDPHTPTVQDGVNRLAFRRVDWCMEPRPKNSEVDPCHSPGALAITTSYTDSATGRILEADIEVNAAITQMRPIAWTDRATGPAFGPPPDKTPLFDLQNAITHEIGHFVGFAHSCRHSADDVAPYTDRGEPVQSCFSSPDAIATTSTMFPTSQPDDLSRRTLTEDDLRGLCELYPAGGMPSGLVQAEGPVGCAMAGRSSGAPLALLLPLIAAIRRRRR
jgi:hypothetical protein